MRGRNKNSITEERRKTKNLCRIVWKVGQQVKMLGAFGRRSAVPHPKLELEEVGWNGWLAPYQAISPLLAWII